MYIRFLDVACVPWGLHCIFIFFLTLMLVWTIHITEIRFNNILPRMPGPSKWFLSLRFSYQNFVCIYVSFHGCYLSHPFYYFNILWRVQIMTLLIMQLFSSPQYLLCLVSKYSPQFSVMKHAQFVFCWYQTPQVSHLNIYRLNFEFCIF
jgi:hypothetical protein